jgi:DNA polymerase-3 subunit epsilon
MVAEAPPFSVIGNEFSAFCEGDVCLIAHNNDTFDSLFLKAEYSRHNLTIPPWKMLDSLKWARRYRNDLPRHTLQSLREVYGIPSNNAHRALDDVIVLHQVFQFMIDDLPLDEVFKLINRPKEIQHMPFGKHQGKPLKEVPKDYVAWMAGSGAFDKPENQELKSRFQALGLLTA